jgi:hypothetical protein
VAAAPQQTRPAAAAIADLPRRRPPPKMQRMHTQTLVLLAGLTLVAASPAQQQPPQEKLIELRDEKLAKPVFQLAKWNTDYDAVREEAKKSGKLIFAYFTRSYAH